MLRRLLLLMFVPTALLSPMSMPVASATAPIREAHTQDDFVIADGCAFSVLGHIDGAEIVTLYSDPGGDPFMEIVSFPGNRITLTNLATGSSITVQGTGSSQVRVEQGGSLSARAMGHGIFSPNPLTGAPGIWYLSGQGRSTLDEQGNVTSAELHGTLVDLCPRLAA